MSRLKLKIYHLIILLGFLGWFVVGFKVSQALIKPKIIEFPVVIKEPLDWEDPLVFQLAVEEVSEKYGIKPEVFYAIRECEGGHLWAWNKTQDGGYFQINWKTAKQYGAKDLEDLINPYKSAELAAKIIKFEGLDAWRTKKCIIEKIITFATSSKEYTQ